MCWMITYIEEQNPLSGAVPAYTPPQDAHGIFLAPRLMSGRQVYAVSPTMPHSCCCPFFCNSYEADDEPEAAQEAARLQKNLSAFIAQRMEQSHIQPYLFLCWGESLADFTLPAVAKPLPLASVAALLSDYEPQGFYRLER